MSQEIVPIKDTHIIAPIERTDHNPAVVYLASLAVGSRPAMQGALDTIARMVTNDEEITYEKLPWAELRFQHTAFIRSELAKRYAHSTANKILSALRGTLKAAWKLGQMSAEEYHKAASIESVKGETVPAGRSVATGELRSLLLTCDQTRLGIRDAAILSLLYGCGLRRAEVVTLDVADYNSSENQVRVQGKRNKQRLVPVLGGVAAAVTDWLACRGQEPGPLFFRIRRGDHVVRPFKRLTTQAVYKMLNERAKQAGVEKLSPHDLRRSFVGDLLDAGADIVTVQKLSGHADVSTTARYDRRGERVKQQAAALLHVPYQRRLLRSAVAEESQVQ